MPFSALEEKHSRDPKVTRLLAEYSSKKLLYEGFCSAMVNILKKILDSNNYKYHITCRAKNNESLKEKIVRKMTHGKRYRKLGDIEDLAGVRVIFYSEADKKDFVKHFYEEFTAARIRMEHHAHKNGYKAVHAIVTLGPDRLKLAEYSEFKGLKCEVQITSILYHAWAEFEHDIFYKNSYALEKDKATFKVYKRKLHDALLNYIENAVKEFEEIAKKTHLSQMKNTTL
jgi:ppGpp synthetase/RelA/SpoT-type nucleotidyltranferase